MKLYEDALKHNDQRRDNGNQQRDDSQHDFVAMHVGNSPQRQRERPDEMTTMSSIGSISGASHHTGPMKCFRRPCHYDESHLFIGGEKNRDGNALA